jgi:hypothetical protein
MLKTGICKLCQLEKPLLNKSHIIPEFMYESLFDNGHKLNKLVPVELFKGQGRIQRPSSGVYESGLLCKECDNTIIGGYETYARNALYAKEGEYSDLPECTNFITNGVKYTRCKNLHYKEFKLFLLSILWRASISSQDVFNRVKLGPYEESIRQMIYNGNPKEALDFPILMMTWINDKSFPSDIIMHPEINRKENGIRYIFPIAGMVYVFHISSVSLRQELREYILLPSNEASFLYIPEGRSSDFFLSYYGIKNN